MTKKRKKKHTKTRVRKAIEENLWIKDMAAELCISRTTLYKYLDEYDLWDYFKINQGRAVDIAEYNAMTALYEGDMDVTKFVLDRLGSTRGWSRKPDEQNVVTINVELATMLERHGVSMNDVMLGLLDEMQQMEQKEASQLPAGDEPGT